MFKILLVDDDPQSLDSTRKILEMSGYDVTTAGDGQAGLEKIRAQADSHFDLVITDVRMPRLGGLEFLRAISLRGDAIPVILMTAFGKIEDAVWAMKIGAVDFLTKPFKRQALISAIEGALKRAQARAVPASSDAVFESRQIIGQSDSIRRLKAMIAQIAPTAATVLITGESGTGKEKVARSIHDQSTRAKNPFVAINCAAVPEQLMESELFGFEKGAFTGATTSKQGLFESANGGTLLLDEIGDMPFSLQAKLLRALQEGEVRRLGSNSSRKIDVRVLAATHRDLRNCVQMGTFRQDLLFRLEVIGVQVSPLWERADDIPELAQHFLKFACHRHTKNIELISDEAMQVLKAYRWPGNVRELSNVMERAVVFAENGVVRSQDLPPHLAGLAAGRGTFAEAGNWSSISVRLGTPLKDVEDLLIRKTLEATSGDKNMTAKLLGINSRTIYRKLDGKKPEKEDLPQPPEHPELP
ncbi:MAG: sigma-54-dependent Fis family transcriptional regulator [Methylotenera sp.]|nr:sigma-54-dependent Fis family transcriptional regulator [Oligoflexia bacterium]